MTPRQWPMWAWLGLVVAALGVGCWVLTQPVHAAPAPEITLPDIQIGQQTVKGPNAVALPLQILVLMTTLSLAPYILVMATSFIRITIVLSFLRTAMGTQQVPPTQVLMGLALFMTMFIMTPVWNDINKNAVQPLMKNQITQQVFLQRAGEPIKKFMLLQTRNDDIKLFLAMGRLPQPNFKKDTPIQVILPAFVLSEVKTAFEIGFLLYLPFLVIDMVVASVLMSMGMFMLSPMSISMPFKLLLFVMINGWGLLIEGLVRSFHFYH